MLNLVTYQSSQPGIATATGTGTSFITKGIAPSNGDAVVRGYVDGEICNSPSNAELTVRTVWVTYHPLTNNVFRVAQQRSRTLNANVMHSSAPVTYQYATGATAPATISRNGNTFTIQGKAGRDGETMPLTAKLNGVDCGGTTIKVNRLPTVSISVPANGASYMVNAKLSIRVSTSDPDGSPHYVKILNVYVDGGLIWSTTNPSSSVSVPAFTLKNVGKHRVNVCATDDDDDSKWSAEHVFYVTPNPPAPPSGQDYEIYNPYGDYTDLHTLWLKGQLHTHWYNDADKLWGGTYGLYSPDYSRRA